MPGTVAFHAPTSDFIFSNAGVVGAGGRCCAANAVSAARTVTARAFFMTSPFRDGVMLTQCHARGVDPLLDRSGGDAADLAAMGHAILARRRDRDRGAAVFLHRARAGDESRLR